VKQLERLASKAEKEQKLQEAKVKKVIHTLHNLPPYVTNSYSDVLLRLESICTAEYKKKFLHYVSMRCSNATLTSEY